MAIFTKSHTLDLESGSTQYAAIAHASQMGLSLTSNFTIMFWTARESNPGNNARFACVSKHDGSTAGYEIGFFTTGGGVVQLETRVRQNGSTEDVKQNNLTTLGFHSDTTQIWHHVAWVVSFGPTLSQVIYLDGIDRVGAQTGSTTAVGTNTSEFAIGARSGGSNHYDGLLSDVKVFNAALTQSEVIAHMRHYRATSNQKGQWRFQNTYTDASAGGNTLTPVNSPTFNTTNFPFITYGRTTRFYVGSGDGSVESSDASSWDTAHDATTGDSVSVGASTFKIETSKPAFNAARTIRRGFIPINTATFDANVQIIGGSLGINPTANTSSTGNSIVIVQATQADATTLALTDFPLCGSINSPAEGASRYGNIKNAAVNWIDLNATGVSWINLTGYTKLGLRMPRDADDSDYVSSSLQEDSVTFNASEATATINDPFIDIMDDDEFYGGTTGSGGTGQAGDFGGVDLGGGSGAPPGEYVPPTSGGGEGGSGPGGASDENTVALAGIFFVE